MQVFVRTLSGKTITLDVDPSDTVGHAMRKIQDAEGVPRHAQRLVAAGRSLLSPCRLMDQGIVNESVLQLLLPLRGGAKKGKGKGKGKG